MLYGITLYYSILYVGILYYAIMIYCIILYYSISTLLKFSAAKALSAGSCAPSSVTSDAATVTTADSAQKGWETRFRV